MNNANYNSRKITSPTELNERITLQYSTVAADSMGKVTTTWNTHATVWASTWTVSSAEGETGLVRIRKFKIRHRKLMNASWRVSWRGQYYNITAVDPDKTREFIFLTTKEMAA